MKIIWTRHAEERQKEWERKLGISKQEIEDLLRNPSQIVPGDIDALIAQIKNRSGLIRVPFKEEEKGRKIITIYWTSKIEKYWKEEKNEN